MVYSNYIYSTENLPIWYSIYTPYQVKKTLPVVIFVHGFKGFKDWGLYPYVCELLASQNIAVIAINLSGSGVVNSDTIHTRLDLFAKATLSQDHKDIGSVVNAILNNTLPLPKDVKLSKKHIGLLGHSRGGHSVIVFAAESVHISTVITWAAVADCNERWTDRVVEDWQNQGYTTIKHARTGQIMRLDRDVYDDARKNKDWLMALIAAKNLTMPLLVLHGDKDEVVPVDNAHRIYDKAASIDKKCVIISNGSHTFGAAHPFSGKEKDIPKPFQQALNITMEWFKTYLT